jgi:hypothetical protein
MHIKMPRFAEAQRGPKHAKEYHNNIFWVRSDFQRDIILRKEYLACDNRRTLGSQVASTALLDASAA